MANRNSARRGRSRKRRPTHSGPQKAQGSQQATSTASPDQQTPAPRAQPSAGRRSARQPAGESRSSVDERPRAPWHPLPLSELLILVGAVATVVGLRRSSSGFSAGAPTLAAGLAAVLIGTLEVTLREHRSGYRSHALLLAALPVIVFHSAVVLALAAFTRVPRALNLGLLVLDIALFTLLFKLLRARFVDARRERRFVGGG